MVDLFVVVFGWRLVGFVMVFLVFDFLRRCCEVYFVLRTGTGFDYWYGCVWFCCFFVVWCCERFCAVFVRCGL